ncbi:MAG TPA: aminotransferase class I/II-fold pyridoxal phosphate-dependent enzyme [Acidobacteriaceae bacterium]|nr:aminotransferase class I/II-fold pyridoxal phosphate-dependent enzyme [Acidobacteriaceae bacterium]
MSSDNSDKDRILQPETAAIHGNRVWNTPARPILFPIHQTATYVHDGVGVTNGFGYSRGANPTVDALEQAIAALEGTPGAVCFRTGMAAITTLCLAVLQAGDHVVLSEVIYGGTIRLFRQVLENFGVETSFVDTASPDAVRAAVKENTRLFFIETPANPTMLLTDIRALADIAQERNILLAVDNTFLTPLLQRPLELGAHISMLSTTKYIDGHNATIGGSLATKDEALLERLRFVRKILGTIQAPQEAWLTLQGMKTLPARMRIHCDNAQRVAEWLAANPAVEHVNYPGLASFPQAALARRQQNAPGGMLSFELKAGTQESLRFINALRLCTCAESLGSVETLVTNPATASHCDLPLEVRERLGITDRLIRLSVGIEHIDDILADLQQALAQISLEESTSGGNQ